ncbi:hypothetical protein [Paenibacillus sp. SI8]|uniref:hypothetical protein n=1 Tax=unclassified Paenibacillus TaxID=185978 RepID=UPI003465CB2E
MYTNPLNQQGPQGTPGMQLQPGTPFQQVPHVQPTPQVIYQGDSSHTPILQQKKHAIHSTLHPHIGKHIQVQTIDGHKHEGTLVHVDGHHAYIYVHPHGHHHHHHHHPHPHYHPYGQHPHGQNRPIYTPAQYNQIITLVLFELLVILLLS